LCSSFFCSGQTGKSFNLNADNGLLSNHVYGMITDRHGYLWICTDKGVAKYNGYECRFFDMSDGLPSDDIWELMEDAKGRIWLGTINEEFGYLYNDKYKKPHYAGDYGVLYPMWIRKKGNGIVFHSSSFKKELSRNYFTAENDTIRGFRVFDPDMNSIRAMAIPFIDELGEPVYIYKSGIYRLGGKYRYDVRLQKVADINGVQDEYYYGKVNYCIGDYIITANTLKKNDSVTLTNIRTGKLTFTRVNLDQGDKIQFTYPEKKALFNNFFFFVADHHIYRCHIDSGKIAIHNKYDFRSLVSDTTVHASKINTVHQSDMWDMVIGTVSNGAYVNFGEDLLYHKAAMLKDYVLVGCFNDSLAFWWNKFRSDIVITDKNAHIVSFGVTGINNLKQVTHYSSDTFLVAAEFNHYLIPVKRNVVRLDGDLRGSNVRGVLVHGRETLTFISGFGVYHSEKKNGQFSGSFIDHNRYEGLLFDSLRGKCWAYNAGSIATVNDPHSINFARPELKRMGIITCDRLCLDNKFGNIFVKGYDNIVVFTPENKQSKSLYGNFSFKDESQLLIHNNVLIVAWKHGVLFSKITGPLQTTQPIVYPNEKCIKYKMVLGAAVLGGKLHLNTDNGYYVVRIPSDSELLANKYSNGSKYHFVLQNADSIYDIVQNRIVCIRQPDKKIVFDVINPKGTGKPKFYYSLSGGRSWTELSAPEFTLPESLVPDKYYKLLFYATDNTWKSEEHTVFIYIVPYWWQTAAAQKVIWAGAILLGLLILVIAVLLTRRQVLRSAEKRQLQMEMELKSIYAQINPHFIFNSLNSALLMVSKNRMDDAYTHISRFSRLLRSYLRSSRNRYVSIADEVANLMNYIELQQTRFKSRFIYTVQVDGDIAAETMRIPSLLIQPFVENAINHGILPMEREGKLDVRFDWHKKENKIICTIEDNGIGREQSKTNNMGAEDIKDSYGDLMIKDLVSIFNKYEKMNIEIRYFDKELPATGTIVTIIIKNPHYES